MSPPTLTRRAALGGLGSAIVTAATGFTVLPARALGPVTVLELGAIDFRPVTSATYQHVISGGMRVTEGPATVAAGLRLPVGSRILGAWVYLNPNGQSRLVQVNRYRPTTGSGIRVAEATSTNGTAIETVKITVRHDVMNGWNYAFAGPNLIAGAILYGARIRYRPPV
jgi:hypothetical protein